MIMKLQKPLASNEAGPPWMAYDKSRLSTWLVEAKDIPQSVKDALGDDPKGYFETEAVKGKPVFGKRVEDQPW